MLLTISYECPLRACVKLGTGHAMIWVCTHHPKCSYFVKSLMVPFLPPQISGTLITKWVSFIFIKRSSWIYFVPWRSFGDIICLHIYFLFKDDGRESAVFKPNGEDFLQWNFKHYGTWVGIFVGKRFILSHPHWSFALTKPYVGKLLTSSCWFLIRID